MLSFEIQDILDDNSQSIPEDVYINISNLLKKIMKK